MIVHLMTTSRDWHSLYLYFNTHFFKEVFPFFSNTSPSAILSSLTSVISSFNLKKTLDFYMCRSIHLRYS
ncbi:hypothetical protein XELAEV_18023240mg [Xenopus laevis]|uniref:Uncharacterized protein n=1 Tax=Xenopus laevis TaxID=8355 RepID=A0A974D6F2_XENLA|nr:hypothetical protein XELAEV_18023240mg [Xenopus laevis]